jgi:hypothetical protein
MSEIHSPNHYTKDRKYEPWDVIADWGLNFDLGNVVKYVSRAGRKEDESLLDDLLKAKEYLEHQISRLRGEAQ